jgi:oxalate decarboxylase/phosphoglucose isomerase-like protein (cupin superfamily)
VSVPTEAVVVRPGEGHRVGNVEFLARSQDTPRFNLALVPPGVTHTFANRGDAAVRMLNIHAPAGFDRRLLGE